MERKIKNHENYTITDDGKIYSYKQKTKRQLKTYYDKHGYENIKVSDRGEYHHWLIHRLVAEAFIDNPERYPEVDHINKDRKDNRVENLRWCDRKFNLEQSYETMSPNRNYRVTLLKIGGKEIGYFKGTKLASEYAAKFGYSPSSLRKYRHCRDAEIIIIDVTTIENEDIHLIESLTEVE